MPEILWSERHHAKYRIGDLVCLYMAARESAADAAALRDLRRQIRSAVAAARSLADQENAALRDAPPADD